MHRRGQLAKGSHMERFDRIFAARLAVLIGALALMLIPFAHPAGAALSATPMTPELQTYLAQGGTIDDLCLTDGHGDPAIAHAECPACALGKSLLLASTPIVASSAVAAPDPDAPLRDCGPLRAPVTGSPPVRGPPVSHLI